MKILKIIVLYPISVIYGFVVNIRNLLFDINVLKSQEFDIPIISIGNITVGGTGKTPTSEYIIRLLEQEYKIAVLSRGYKRKTSGFLLADENSSPEDIGDEPYQIKQKFKNIIVAVDGNRIRGIKMLQKSYENLDLIILDDAFQHRYVKPGLSVLIIDYTQPIFEDRFIPSGRLRDSKNEIDRANIILVTKAPESLKPIDMRIMATNLSLKAYQSLFFSHIKYKEPIIVNNSVERTLTFLNLKDNDVLLVSGIGNPKPLINFCETSMQQMFRLQYKDHYKYTEKDIQLITSEFNKIQSDKKIILTTEKDAVKLKLLLNKESFLNEFLFYIPLEIEILNNDKEDFDKLIVSFVKKGKGQVQFLTSVNQY